VHLMTLLLWFPPPGSSVAVLALLAGIMPLLEECFKRRRWLRIIYVLALAFLCFAEIHSVTLEQHQFRQDMSFLQARLQDTSDRLQDIQTSMSGVGRINNYLSRLSVSSAKKPTRAKPQEVPLKVEALQLARDIYNFVAQRREIEPRFNMPAYSDDRQKMRNDWDTEAGRVAQLWQSFEAETVRSYLVNYSGRVTSLISKLKDKGLWNTQVCDFSESPVFYVRCASKIEEAAQKLP